MLEIRLLGQFDLRLNGEPVNLPSRAGQSLLAYLALTAGTSHRRERLAGLLWPEADESRARRSLRQALWRLREALGRDYILADDISIAFDADSDYWLDAARLLDDEDGAPESLMECLEVYQGELLPGFYDEWVLPERERLLAVYERKAQTLLDHLIEARHWPETVAWAERWIALGGAPEPAYRALMIAHAGQGDLSGAATVFQRCAEALSRELGVEPSDSTRRLLEQLRARAAEETGGPSEFVSLPAEAGPAGRDRGQRHNLPLQLTSFVGREREVAEVRRMLGGPNGARRDEPGTDEGPALSHESPARPRLLTLTGPAGTGKTRLAMEAVGGLLDAFTDGVWLVELAPVADPALVPQAVAAALGVREDQGRPLEEALQGYLRDKKLLLLMDNCEHLIDACARLAETLLRASPGVNVLATSRESLGIPGETALRVPSLAVPDPRRPLNLSELARFDAVRLFVDRAGAVQPDFRLSAQNGPAVAQLVTRLDGIPLAIELAAARLKALSVEQVAERLNDRFRLLTGGSRTALPRQQTLQALIDWSYDLLSEAERVLLRRLSVFAGGFSLEAAEVVAASKDDGRSARRKDEEPGSSRPPSSAGLQPSDVLDLLMRLVDKSLVISERAEGEGRARYRLLETIRQYALERLIEAGGEEAERARSRHLAHFLALAEQAEPKLRGSEQMAWLDRLDLEHDNLRAALEWSLGAGRSGALDSLRLAGSLWRFWYLRSSRTEGRAWLERALAVPTGVDARDLDDLAAREPALAAARATALAGLGWLTHEFTKEVPAYAESLALCRALNDRWGQAFALRGLGTTQLHDGDKEQARGLLEESLALFRQLADPWGEALVLFNLAWLPDKSGGDSIAGVELWTESLRLFRQTGDRWGIAVTLAALSQEARTHGDYDRAAALSHDSLALFRELGDRAGMASSLNHLALVAYRRGDYGHARELFEKNLALNRETANVEGESWALLILGLIACYQGEYAKAGHLLDRSAALLEEIQDEGDFVLLLAFQGLLAYYQGDEAQAERLWEESATLAREQRDYGNMGVPLTGLGLIALRQGQRVGMPLTGLGEIALRQGQRERAAELFEESLAASRAVGEKRNEAMSLCSLGRLARAVQDFDAARTLYRQCLQLRRELGAKRGTAETLDELARLAVALGGPENARRAARLFGAAEALRERIGAPLPPVERDEHDRCVAAARACLDADEFARLWTEGREMGMEAAVAYALEAGD